MAREVVGDMTHTSACLGTWLGVLAARKNSCSWGSYGYGEFGNVACGG